MNIYICVHYYPSIYICTSIYIGDMANETPKEKQKQRKKIYIKSNNNNNKKLTQNWVKENLGYCVAADYAPGHGLRWTNSNTPEQKKTEKKSCMISTSIAFLFAVDGARIYSRACGCCTPAQHDLDKYRYVFSVCCCCAAAALATALFPALCCASGYLGSPFWPHHRLLPIIFMVFMIGFLRCSCASFFLLLFIRHHRRCCCCCFSVQQPSLPHGGLD